ncbi:MAG: zinc-dependent peptidase [Burkholderiaceae bacterium]|jgi:Mlc titration factor MtfA (ptsG expression regulator)|nr:zinc-dependent peptidase [Burkholderiaceae bacterium]
MLKNLLGRFTRSTGVAIPDDLWDAAVAALPCAAALSAGQAGRLRQLASRLLAEKEMSTAGDLELTAAMQVNIAVQACLPILELGLEWYRGWSSIVVYPGEFLVPRSLADEDGVVHEYVEPITGEAWEGGPLLLSWEDAQRSTTDSGSAYSVVIHEFAHKIDLLDGAADGRPPFSRDLHPGLDARRWDALLADTFERFLSELDLIESELPEGVDPDSPQADPYYAHLPFDPYAAHDEAEFFAVSSEAFFIEPASLQRAFPEWYALLAAFFRQDPLARTHR